MNFKDYKPKSSERKLTICWIVKKVHARNTRRQNVYHSHRYQFVIQPILLVKRAISMRWPTIGYPLL